MPTTTRASRAGRRKRARRPPGPLMRSATTEVDTCTLRHGKRGRAHDADLGRHDWTIAPRARGDAAGSATGPRAPRGRPARGPGGRGSRRPARSTAGRSARPRRRGRGPPAGAATGGWRSRTGWPGRPRRSWRGCTSNHYRQAAGSSRSETATTTPVTPERDEQRVSTRGARRTRPAPRPGSPS